MVNINANDTMSIPFRQKIEYNLREKVKKAKKNN